MYVVYGGEGRVKPPIYNMLCVGMGLRGGGVNPPIHIYKNL